MLNSTELSRDMLDQVCEWMDEILSKYFSGPVIPRYLAGHLLKSDAIGDMLYVLGLLKELGVEELAGRAIDDWLFTFLKEVSGKHTHLFYSYRLAETLKRMGELKDSPKLAELGEDVLAELEQGIDSTWQYDKENDDLRGYPNNYWAVLARCEYARQQLGMLDDDWLLNHCIGKLSAVLFANPRGFFDDSKEMTGCYDSYSADILLFSETFWHLLDTEKLEFALNEHVKLFESIVMENGASVVWGRSTGALSVAMTMEMGACALKLGLTNDPERWLGLIEHAYDQFCRTWMQNGLITAHRYKSPYKYREEHRLFQMTLDLFGKLLYTVKGLKSIGEYFEITRDTDEDLFSSQDKLHLLDDQNACVWMYRNDWLSFQLPFIGGRSRNRADYVAWLHGPHLFDNPVDSGQFCGVPVVIKDQCHGTFVDRPVSVRHEENTVEAHFDGVYVEGEIKPGKREVSWKVKGRQIHVLEKLIFDEVPDALSYAFPVSYIPSYDIELKSSVPFSKNEMDVRGLKHWKTFWGKVHEVQEFHFEPSKNIELEYVLTKRLNVLVTQHEHDYPSSLFEHITGSMLDTQGSGFHECMQSMEYFIDDATRDDRDYRFDAVYIGWPEHIASHEDMEDPEKLQTVLGYIQNLGQRKTKVIWTMHNRLPHSAKDWSVQVYEAWAKVTDVALHHSEWGMARMKELLPFKDDCRHEILPHGHFGPRLKIDKSREELEEQFGLSPAKIRIGVVGRPQKEKQIEMIMQAFAKSTNPDIQLFVTAVDPEYDIPEDPRLFTVGWDGIVPREVISERVNVNDVLVSCPTGDHYLTSGITADAVGLGVGLIINRFPYLIEAMGDAGIVFNDTEEDLTRLFNELTVEQVEAAARASKALQDAYSWETVGAKLREIIYEECGMMTD